MRKGIIALVPFPFTDQTGNKIRPVLVLGTPRGGEDCIVAAISSQAKRRSARDVTVKASEKNGLKVNSLIRVSKIATLQKHIFLGPIGVLEPLALRSVDAQLRTLLSL